MDEETVKKPLTPFIPQENKEGRAWSSVLRRPERCGGTFAIKSKPGEGTEVYAGFRYDNIDRPCWDMPETIFSLALPTLP